MGKRPRADDGRRWHAHPVLSWTIRTLVLLIPVAAGVASAAILSRIVPRPAGSRAIAWWVLLFAGSGVTAWAVDRVARRLLPLAVLLELTLLFPDRAPSRYAVARRVGSTRKLAERVRLTQEAGIEDDPTRAAVRILELVAALNAHDRQTRGHSERVRALTDLLADALRIPRQDRDRLRWSALLHDIGKLEVSADILNKPGKPEPHEWDALKRHPAAGARLAGPLLPWLGEWGAAIEQHHERYDGDGYPVGLAGTRISLGGRILTVTDSFETMTASRSYKKPMSVTAARRELAGCAGAQFDPDVVRTFIDVSLGRLWWKVGPLSWVAQLPFISFRVAGGSVAGVARAGAAAAAKAAVGLVALGASAFVSAPNLGLERSPVVAESVSGQASGGDQGESPHPAPSGDQVDGDATSGQDEDGNATGVGDGGTGTGQGSGSGSGGSGGSSGPGGGGGGSGGGSDPVGDLVGGAGDLVEGVAGGAGDLVADAGETMDDLLGGLTGALGGGS